MRQKIIMGLSLIFFIPLFLLVLQSPRETEAISIFSPFGGRVISWLPDSPGCAVITKLALAVGINITIEELRVSGPHGGTFGLLKINGFTPPGLTTIYKQGNAYRIPGSSVLGNAINLCNVCGGNSSDPISKTICNGIGKEVMERACGALAGACPIGNIVHKIGSARGF